MALDYSEFARKRVCILHVRAEGALGGPRAGENVTSVHSLRVVHSSGFESRRLIRIQRGLRCVLLRAVRGRETHLQMSSGRQEPVSVQSLRSRVSPVNHR